jgi:hypothetical protein
MCLLLSIMAKDIHVFQVCTQLVCCHRGLIGTVGTIAREEGASALWKGLEPGWWVLLHQSLHMHDRWCLHEHSLPTTALGTTTALWMP